MFLNNRLSRKCFSYLVAKWELSLQEPNSSQWSGYQRRRLSPFFLNSPISSDQTTDNRIFLWMIFLFCYSLITSCQERFCPTRWRLVFLISVLRSASDIKAFKSPPRTGRLLRTQVCSPWYVRHWYSRSVSSYSGRRRVFPNPFECAIQSGAGNVMS